MNAPETPPPPPPPPPPVPSTPVMSPEQLHADLNTIRSVLGESAAARGPHRMIIALANLVCGAFMVLAVPIVLVVFGIPVFLNPGEKEMIAVILIGLISVLVLTVLAIPFILAGWGLLKSKSWGPTAAVVASILNVLNMPFGTILAAYTFWALTTGKLEVERSLPAPV